MNASPAAADTCASCGAQLPADARFCPACGSRAAVGETARVELPPDETGPVPVTVQHAEAHWFGVTPPYLLLGLAGAAFVVAIVLFATGHWPFALIALGIGALLLAAWLETARRRPTSQLARGSVDARERARSTWETLRARQDAAAEYRRVQSELALLEPERDDALRDLGTAAYTHDAPAEAGARAKLAELDSRETGLRAALERAQADAEQRIHRARLPVQETVMVLPSEPSPPPGEATPPQPATVPEPYPPPDEGTPPQPAKVPEPGPDPAPEREDSN